MHVSRTRFHHSVSAFTLLETLLVIVMFVAMITVVTTSYLSIVKTKAWLEVKQSMITAAHSMLTSLQATTKGYTIDYEEYFNRKMVWCSVSSLDYCDIFSTYGNTNSIGATPNLAKRRVYGCTTKVVNVTDAGYPLFRVSGATRDEDDQWEMATNCVAQALTKKSWPIAFQSFGQYAFLATDRKVNVDTDNTALFDDDDRDLGALPPAIASWSQEIYLISMNNDRRIYIRRKLIDQWDRDKSGTTWDIDIEKRYTLQMLQLKGFDAWDSHNFAWSGVYDGQIDTRTCDADAGYICSGIALPAPYTAFRLPGSVEDGRVSLFSSDMTIYDWKISLSPITNPSLTRNIPTSQISPIVWLSFTIKPYARPWIGKVPIEQLKAYSLPIQTSLSFPFL
jgi:type II secretory pathway pseudopilin PulG